MILYWRYMYHPFMLCETESKVTKVRGYKLASIFSLEFVYICCARLLNLGQEGH